jgi:hypothetical protein
MIKGKGEFIFRWDTFILLLITYSAIEIPFGMVEQYRPPVAIYIFNSIVSLFFIIDIAVRFRHARVNSRKYKRGWLIIDIIAAIPFELLYLTGAGFYIIGILRVTRLVKVLRVWGFKPVWEYHINLNPGIVRLGFFFYFMLLSVHWISCGWVSIRPHANDADMVKEYIRALYWCATTVTTIGFGDITPDKNSYIEMIYTIGVAFFGAGAFGYVIGNIATLLTNLDTAKTRHRERVDRVDNFMKAKKLPKHLQERVHHYYNYLWDSRHGYDDATILADLPDSFRYEFAQVLNREILKKVPLFKGADHNLLKEIAVCLRPCIYTPGDAICTYGEVGDKMYFIRKGFVEVMSHDGKEVYATLRDGDFFGELALLTKLPRNANIRSVDYCDLYSLNKESFDNVISNYPDFERSIQLMAHERMNGGA